jgi:chromosome segregation ATPase
MIGIKTHDKAEAEELKQEIAKINQQIDDLEDEISDLKDEVQLLFQHRADLENKQDELELWEGDPEAEDDEDKAA